MAAKNRQSVPEIKDELINNGRKFSFFQGIRLLRQLIRKESGQPLSEQDLNSKVFIRPNLSLDFPGSDIIDISEIDTDQKRYIVTASFLGLYGSSSPLPVFYTEDLLDEMSDGSSITRDFIDILNSTLYPLFYNSWSKYRIALNLYEEKQAEFTQDLYCLLGLGDERFQRKVPDSFHLLRYIGLTTQMSRSAEGLRALLSDYLDEPKLEIEQCIPRMAEIPSDQRFSLGENANILGEDSHLGEQILDRMGKFRISIGPLDEKEFHRILPDQLAFTRIHELVNFYLDQPLQWDLKIQIKSEEAQTSQLGVKSWGQLGWDTWLLNEQFTEDSLEVSFL